MAEKSKIIDYLGRFNPKERFILLNHMLGKGAEGVFSLNPISRGNWRTSSGWRFPTMRSLRWTTT